MGFYTLSSSKACILGTLVTLAKANPLASSSFANIAARQEADPNRIIASITWYEAADCDFFGARTAVYDVGPNAGFNPDNCDPSLPAFNGGTLDWVPRSFSVTSGLGTCNPDIESGQQLSSITLWPSCTPKVVTPEEPVRACSGECAQEGWSRTDDGYGACINTSEEYRNGGPYATTVDNRVAFC